MTRTYLNPEVAELLRTKFKLRNMIAIENHVHPDTVRRWVNDKSPRITTEDNIKLIKKLTGLTGKITYTEKISETYLQDN